MKDEKGVTYFVSTEGNDDWSGKLPEANADRTDGPFVSLARARDAVRQARSARGALNEPVTIMVRGGMYFLDSTLTLKAEDSGTRKCPVTWCAYPGETPILSGGKALSGWEPYDGSILRTRLPDAGGGRFKTRQLFYKGKRQRRARWPKFDPDNPIRGGWAFAEGPVEGMEKLAFCFKQGELPRWWNKPHEGEVNVFAGHGWCNSIIPIERVDYERRFIQVAREPFKADIAPWFIDVTFSPGNRYFVENILEELTEPGEWCFDSSEGVLYFWPPDDPPGDGDVIVPALDCLVRIRDAQWITMRGLTFTHTRAGDNYHRSGLLGYGAMFPQPGLKYCGEAVHLRGARHCAIESCHFDQVGGNGVYLESANYRNVIRRNEIAYAGANAIVLIGDRAFHPMFNEVTENHIHHAGSIINYVAGVAFGFSDGNLIAHNFIHDMPHHAVNLGSNGVGRNIIEYNEIRRVCLEIHDTGAINTWMDVPGPWIEAYAERSGHVIRHNLIVDVPGCKVENGRVVDDDTTRGIYLDDCTSNWFVYGNVIVRAGMGVQIHGGKHNFVENNIIFDCRQAMHCCDYPPLRPGNEHILGMFRGNRFVRNISCSSRADAMPFSFHAWTEKVMERCDENLFHHPAAEDYHVDWISASGVSRSSFEEWQAMGFDHNSAFGDPLFADASIEDFNLDPDSPALKLGFQPIRLSEVGIRTQHGKGLRA